MKNIFIFFVLAGCSVAPAQNFLDQIAGKSVLVITQDVDDDPNNHNTVSARYTVKSGGQLFQKEDDAAYQFRFVREAGNYVAVYDFYVSGAKKSSRYFTWGSKAYVSELLSTPSPAIVPEGDFLGKIKTLPTIEVGKFTYIVSADGKTLTENHFTEYKYIWKEATGNYSAVYEFWDTSRNKHFFSKIFTWRNGYYTSETVDFEQ